MLLPEPKLRGLESNPENEFTKNGPLCDGDLFPRHFLQCLPLTPAEYHLSSALSARKLSQIISRRMNPLRVDVHRACLTRNGEFMSDVETIRLHEPTRAMTDGLTLDIRVRKRGREIDILTSGRCVAHYCLPMEDAFNKPIVPIGSVVGVQSEGGQCIVRFFSHLPDSETPVLSMDQAVVILQPLRFGKVPNLNVELNVTPEEARKFSLLTSKELWEQHQTIRMLYLSVHAPAVWLRSLAQQARDHFANNNNNNNDFDNHPLVLPFEISNQNPRCGFDEQWKLPGDNDTPFRLRFLVSGMDYFEDRAYLDDDGMYHRGEEEEDGEEVEEKE